MSIEWVIIISVIAFGVLLCFLLAIANHAGESFFEMFDYINEKFPKSSIIIPDFINFVLHEYIKIKLEIVQISKLAGDAYSQGKLFLSDETINRDSLASFAVVAHELGHALQDKKGKKLKTLSLFRKIGKVLGFFFLPVLIAGLIMLPFGQALFIAGLSLLAFGGLIFILALILKLVTISIEKEASQYAITFLKRVLDEKEVKLCKKLLNSARQTYWAEFLRLLLFWTAMSRRQKLFN